LIVIDASLMVAWLIGEVDPKAEDDISALLYQNKVVVPSHWPLEIGNALNTNVRRGRIPSGDLLPLQDRFLGLDISVERSLEVGDIVDLTSFALAHNLTVYDAAYVRLAQQHSVPLATLDRAMRGAARHLSIPLLPD